MNTSKIQIVPINAHSDGDISHQPKKDWRLVDPPHIYLEKVASLWMEKRGELKPGAHYYLDHLPEGYRLYERPRPSNAKIIDRHLYGHPRHKFFDSPNRFFPHFEHLMNHGTNDGCLCTICNARGAMPLAIRSGRPPAKVKPSFKSKQTMAKPAPIIYRDEQFAPDTLSHFINKLKNGGTVDEPFQEPMSMDWRAERANLSTWTDELQKQRSWIPRVGELVLFVRALDGGEICRDEEKQEYKVFDLDSRAFVGHPKWESGVVTQLAAERLSLEDLLTEGRKAGSVVYSGFRVEPLPDPNGSDKTLSKKHKYLPLHHMRPMAFWKDFLRGTPKEKWHPTIRHALKVFSSLSLVEKHRFKGTWPSATVFCRGIYLGPEFITVGDAVRLLPDSNDAEASEVTDVLHITNIKYQLSNLEKASGNDDDEGHPYNSTAVLVGKGYTLDASKSFNNEQVLSRSEARSLNLPKGMTGYDFWHRLQDPAKFMQVPFSRVLGRCYAAEPMLLWFPSGMNDGDDIQYPSLSQGVDGVRNARAFSTRSDSRIPEAKDWYWGDSRSDCLGIAEFNGVPISAHDPERDEERLTAWADYVRALERVAGHMERMRIYDRMSAPGTGSASTGTMGAGAMAPPQAAHPPSESLDRESGASDERDERTDQERDEMDVDPDEDHDDPDQQLHSELVASEQSPGIGGFQGSLGSSSPNINMAESEGSNEQNTSLAARFGLGTSTKSSDSGGSNRHQHQTLAAHFGIGSSYQSSRSEASDEHQHQSLAARFGLGASRKRSRSVASLDAKAGDHMSARKPTETDTSGQEGTDEQNSDQGEDELRPVKPVASRGKSSLRAASPSKRTRL